MFPSFTENLLSVEKVPRYTRDTAMEFSCCQFPSSHRGPVAWAFCLSASTTFWLASPSDTYLGLKAYDERSNNHISQYCRRSPTSFVITTDLDNSELVSDAGKLQYSPCYYHSTHPEHGRPLRDIWKATGQNSNNKTSTQKTPLIPTSP